MQRELLAAGFQQTEDPVWAFRRKDRADLFADKHHLHPVRWEGWPMRLEIHRRPSWPAWLPEPPVTELLDVAQPGENDGILTLPPGHHVLVLAAHLWVSNPFARLRDVLDISLLLPETDAAAVRELARAWGMGRLWETTEAVVRSVLLGGATPSAERLWIRHLAAAGSRPSSRYTSPAGPSPVLGAAAPAGSPRGSGQRRGRLSAGRRRAMACEGAAEPARARNLGAPKSQHDEELGPERRQLRR